MPAPKPLGALFFTGLLLFSNNLLHSQETTIDLGQITSVISSPLTTGIFFTEQDIKESNSINLAEFLTQNGILVMTTGGVGAMSNVSINGYAGFCIKVYIDGLLANNPTTGEFDWNQINLESISSIEIQNSPVENQLQYAGSVIRITTKSFGSNQISFSTKILSYENSPADTFEQSTGIQLFTNKSAVKINTNIRTANNEYLTPLNEVNSYNKSELAQIDGVLNTYTSNGSISSSFFLGLNQIKVLNTGTSYDSGVEQDLNSRFTLNRILWGDSIWHSYGTNYNFVDIEYDVSSSLHNSTKVHNLELFYNLDIKNTGFKIYNSLINEWSASMNAYRPQFQNKVFYQTCIFPWLNFQSSLGIDYYVLTNNNQFQDFNYDIIPYLKFEFPLSISFAAFKEFILPTFNQLYWNGAGGIGNPDLQNEYGWSSLISWNKYELFQTSFKTSWYGNKIRWTSKNGILTPDNTSYAWYFIYSIQSSYKWHYFNYSTLISLTRAMLENGNQIMWVPFITASLNLNFNYNIFTWSFNANYTGLRYIDNNNSLGFYEPYLLIDFSQNISLSSNFSINIKIANILDDRYIYHDNYTAPGRSYTLSLRYQN